MHPYARVLGEKDSSNVKTWQRVTVTIRKCFSDLMYPSFREHYRNFIPEVKISKRNRSIRKIRKVSHSSCSALVARKSNRQSLPTSLLNHGGKPAGGSMKKFRNVGVLRNIEARYAAVEKLTDWLVPEAISSNKLILLQKIYSRIKFPSSSLNFVSHKSGNNREVASFNRDSGPMTDDTLNVVEQENWIQRTCCKIKSILPNLHAKIRLHSPTASDSYCSENIFAVDQVIPFSDIISNSPVLFASKDCEDDGRKNGIRKKIQEFCMQRKGSLKKNRDKNEICKKREKYKTKEKCQKREENICEKRKRIDCPERKKQNQTQNVISCKRTESSCDKKRTRYCCKTREQKVAVQEDPCKQKKDDVPKIEEDPCHRQPLVKHETFYELHDSDPCRPDKKVEIKKKEEIKKPDCLEEIKEVKPCEKKTCPPVKKVPECPKDDTKGKGR